MGVYVYLLLLPDVCSFMRISEMTHVSLADGYCYDSVFQTLLCARPHKELAMLAHIVRAHIRLRQQQTFFYSLLFEVCRSGEHGRLLAIGWRSLLAVAWS